MSGALYDKLIELWRDYLEDHLCIYESSLDEESIEEEYDDLVDGFCKEYGYSEKTENMAFYDLWWDTFADMYYQKLEDEGVQTVYENPQEEAI